MLLAIFPGLTQGTIRSNGSIWPDNALKTGFVPCAQPSISALGAARYMQIYISPSPDGPIY